MTTHRRCFKLTKFQDEKRMIFDGRTFSEEKKNVVLNKMHEKKKLHWQPVVALIGAAIIAFLIWFIPMPEIDMKHAFTEKSIEQAYFDLYSPDGFPGVVKYVELSKFDKDDAILITKVGTENNQFYVLYYAKFEEGKWNFLGSRGFREYNEESVNPYEELRTNIGNETLFVGAYHKDNTPERIIVGKEDVEFIHVKDLPPFWVEKVNSMGTPVYFVENHTRKRVMKFGIYETKSLDVIEELPTDFVMPSVDEMHGGYDTYYDYRLVVDFDAYNNTEPYSGDVVLLKNGDFARIIASEKNGSMPMEITVTEGSILINGSFTPVPYMMGHFNGKNTIYDNSTSRTYRLNEGQYFVKSDNWSSVNGFEGIVKKEDITGKVKGYSLMTIQPNWPVEVVKGYSDFQKNHDDKVLKDLDPKIIAIMQKYANYIGDYKTMYELYADSTIVRTYDDWVALINLSPSKASQQRLLYEADLIMRGTFNEKESKVEHIHSITKERKYALNMILENGVWKVKYETIINLNYD